jgi:hypothetical protein
MVSARSPPCVFTATARWGPWWAGPSSLSLAASGPRSRFWQGPQQKFSCSCVSQTTGRPLDRARAENSVWPWAILIECPSLAHETPMRHSLGRPRSAIGCSNIPLGHVLENPPYGGAIIKSGGRLEARSRTRPAPFGFLWSSGGQRNPNAARARRSLFRFGLDVWRRAGGARL